jgi:acyl-coenzyme A synthetase/AMP-(fatty) acid ligase
MKEQQSLFLVADGGQSVYHLSDLLQSVAQLSSVPKYIGRTALFDFYVQLVAAIIYQLDVVILDADFSEEEIQRLTGSQHIQQELYHITQYDYINQNFLLEKTLSSRATLTLFTSGTTGQPKQITHPVTNLLRSAKQGEKYHDNVWALAYNPTHMAGLQVFFQALLNLNPLIYVFDLQKPAVLHLMQLYHVTHISATPTFYRMMMPADFQLNEVKRITLGGEKSSPVLYKQLKKIFPNATLTNIYASTEAGALFYAKGDVFEVPQELIPYVKIENQILFLARKILGQSNYDCDFWYNTGDVVEIVRDNPLSFRFVSRSNEMLNVGGNKVNPEEVEETLLQHGKIKNARVYGRPNSVLGNMLIAEIEAEETLDTNAIRAFLSERLQNFKVPRIIKQVTKIETTRSGKIKRTLQ